MTEELDRMAAHLEAVIQNAVAVRVGVGPEHALLTISQFASTMFRRARMRAKIDDLTFHDSRHDAITRLAQKLNFLQLARMVGHRDIRSLQKHYNETAESMARLL